MSRRTRTLAVLLAAGALAGAGAAPAAQAHTGHHHGARSARQHHHGDGLARLAAKLDVTKAQLQTALTAVKTQQQAAAKPPSYADLVAGQLHVTTDQLKSAMQSARTSTHGKQDFVAALATALSVQPAQVTAAFDAARTQLKAQRKAAYDAFVAALAQQLGQPQDKVAAALTHSRFAGGGCGGMR